MITPTHSVPSTLAAPLRLGEIYVLSVPFLAAFATLGGTALVIGGLNYTGFLWVGALFGGLLLLFHEQTSRPQSASFRAWPWLVWLAWVGMSFIWLDSIGSSNLQDALQLSMPVLVAVVASKFICTPERLEQLLRAYFYSTPLLALAIGMWLTGAFTEVPGATVFVAIRPLACMAIVVAGLFISGVHRNFARAWIGWSACFALSVLSESRMASAAILLLPILNPVNLRLLRKLAVIVPIGLIILAVSSTSAFQERFFGEQRGSLNQIAEGDFDSAGRFVAWPIIFEEALDRPWVGHGEGSVKLLTAEIWDGVLHPHNDYLRIGYELGIVGLVLFVSALLWQLTNLAWWIRHTDGVVQQAFAGAWIGLMAFIPIAMTDNPIVYNLYYMDPVFALMGAAYGVARRQQFAIEYQDRLAEHMSTGFYPPFARRPARGIN